MPQLAYQGRAFDFYMPDAPVTFGKSGKKMIVSNGDGNAHIETVYAYIPGRRYPVITKDLSYRFCAELPEEIPVIAISIPGCDTLYPGKVTMIAGWPNSGKTTALCKAALEARNAGANVVYMSMDLSMLAINRRFSSLTSEKERKQNAGLLTIIEGNTRMTVKDIEEWLDKLDGDTQLLVIDYMNLIKPMRDCEAVLCRNVLYRELLELADKRRIAILTAENISPA